MFTANAIYRKEKQQKETVHFMSENTVAYVLWSPICI